LLTGTHTDVLLINTFAWPGSSGSIVFDESGRVLGVLSAIRVDGPFGIPDLVEHIVLASNIKMLDQEILKEILRNGK
jgi:S1-C subfamily serine protease